MLQLCFYLFCAKIKFFIKIFKNLLNNKPHLNFNLSDQKMFLKEKKLLLIKGQPHSILQYTRQMQFYIDQGPTLQVPYSDQFVHLSFHPSVCPKSLVRSISSQSVPLAQSGSYFSHRVPWNKGCAVTLNHIFRSKLEVLAELYEKSLPRAYLPSPWSNLAQTSLGECLYSKELQ